jgi:sigma-B regulation protein RsbU (phosphoserine phosphatase)
VDDDMTASRMIQAILNRAGYRTRCVHDLAGAWKAIQEQRPDLLLLDVNLPDGNGFDLCRELQSGPLGGSLPVLFISADNEVASKVAGFAAGGVDYIPKPFAWEEVLARVGTHLRLKQAYDTLAELQAEKIQEIADAQEAFMPLPSDLPEARFEVAMRQLSRAGGDFYDVMPVGEHVVDYAVADASGHDLGTSLWTAALKGLLAQYATPAWAPLDALQSINRTLQRILPPGQYFTLIHARLNRRAGTLTLTNAGHPPAAILKGEKIELLTQDGDVLGAFPDAQFNSMCLRVAAGDRLFLYTDGLIEHDGARDQGTRHLLGACVSRHRNALGEAVGGIFQELCGQIPGQDDRVLMGIEV